MADEEELQEEVIEEITPEAVQAVEAEKPNPYLEDMREEMDDLLSLSDEDKAWAFGVAGVGDVPEEESLDDLFDVTEEDIMGEETEEKQKPKLKPRYRITPQARPLPPSTSMGGYQP